MTTPEPVSPEVRRSPDGRLIAYCRSARHGLWRKSDGYDCDTEDVADWTPLVPAVSPAPDTAPPEFEAFAAPAGYDNEQSYAWAAGTEHMRNLALPLLAGLRADLDRARAEVERLNQWHADRDEINAGWVRWKDRSIAKENGYRDQLATALNLWDERGTRPWLEALVPAAVQEIERLRAELAGARTIPDDAAERAALRMFRVHVYGTLTSERYDASARNQWAKVLDEDDRETWRKLARELLADLRATPTTNPAPAAADGPRVWAEGDPEPKGVTEVIGGRTGRRWHREADPHTYGGRWISGAVTGWCAWPTLLANERRATEVLPPAAPQAPAEPKKQCAWWWDTKQCSDWALPDGERCDVHQREYDAMARANSATLAAREDAATPPLPLHEQADLLTWRVVHVPPGTTDREDTDTPITPGWWLVGHGDDPDHPDVQVHLGDRLPTSSAATPGDEYNDDLGSWARPTPIQPEEA